MQRLKRILDRIDGRGYKAYQDIRGCFDFGRFTLFVDHVQGDPFASPSRMRIRVPQGVAGFSSNLFSTHSRNVALTDYLTRRFDEGIWKIAKGRRGSGKSGLIGIDLPGQEILQRSSMVCNNEYVEARITVGLPAAGRRILAKEAYELLAVELPQIVEFALIQKNLDPFPLRRHIEVCEDQDSLRSQLPKLGLVAFIGDGSLLPRRSGVDERPLSSEESILFKSPPELEVSVDLPNQGRVLGMGIPEGVTLIIGGGYHGKTTLLKAIEKGIYNHIPGDGRELVVSIPDTVKIRAEDGRRIERVDISPFISGLPLGKGTRCFSTDNASGSTSQAANIIEALEIGGKLLLIDEDTSATNFMIRDKRMQQLVAKSKEPITPFIDKVRLLHKDYGISTIVVIGGSGDYFDVSDHIIMMDEYRPKDLTKEAKRVALSYPTNRMEEGGGEFGPIKPRIPDRRSFDPSRGKREVKISIKGRSQLLYGRHTIDLTYLEQLTDPSQTRFIGWAIYYLSQRYMDGRRSLKEMVDLLMDEIEKGSLDILFEKEGHIKGDLALARKYELAFAINRLRTLRIK
jgi:predicted ABC-class ATPase